MAKLKLKANNIKKKVKSIQKSAVELLKQNRTLVQDFVDAYFLDELITDKIHNDLGASFTDFKRQGKYIIKKARKEGEDKLVDEIRWYLKFRDTPLSKYLPEIDSYSIKPGKVFVKMKYYTYPNLRKVTLNNLNPGFILKRRWQHLFQVLLDSLYTQENSKPAPADFVEKSHFSKLKKRISETVQMAPFLKEVITADTLLVNGRRYANLGKVLPAITGNERIRARLTPDRIYYAHGDLHCNNILCGISYKSMVLIDCRGKSPYGDMYFDVAYDIAKIYHDLNSYYSLIEKHQYSLFLNIHGDVEIEFAFLDQGQVEKFRTWSKYVESLIKEKFTGFGDLEYRARFTEAMLYLTMIPFHLKVKSEAVMCYATGIIRLNEWLSRYHPEILKEK
ncbi:MAG: hypothetical protein HGA85_01930 [Nanoarchaeota archaeon]|nr:hypothetical protein [Nanoarchaeota archaeon]